jgi:restriction system protein
MGYYIQSVAWQEYYDKMSDEDKNMLPLKRIAFLGNNE